MSSILYSEDLLSKDYGNAICGEVTSVYDGDTFSCNIREFPDIIGLRIRIRINGIDAPEIRDKRPQIKEIGIKAKIYTTNRLRNAKLIELRKIRRDKYFRILADVYVDGEDLGKELRAAGLANSYFGKKKIEWK
jgi:endonuclease YncB( thermonuclease family)